MGKNSKQKPVSMEKQLLATQFVDSIMGRDKKGAEKALSEMVNNRIRAKIRKVAQTENLI